LLLLDTGYTAK